MCQNHMCMSETEYRSVSFITKTKLVEAKFVKVSVRIMGHVFI